MGTEAWRCEWIFFRQTSIWTNETNQIFYKPHGKYVDRKTTAKGFDIMRRISEMPWIRYDRNNIFDLETERFRDVDHFLQYLGDILSGEVETDKYGNTIKLNSREEKLEFIQALKDDKLFCDFVDHRFSWNEKQLLNFIMGI